jgi:ADP-heptose:LPS heptosyltransferase
VILGHDHIGDVLYRTPSLPHLARVAPECRWTFATSPAGAEILEGNPFVHDVRVVQGTGSELRRLLRELNPAVALCTNSVKPYADLVAATLVGVPNRVAFAHKGFSALITHPVQPSGPMTYPALVRELVAGIDGASPDWSLRPQVFPNAHDHAAAERVFERVPGSNYVLAVALTARHKAYRPPVDLLVNAIPHVAEELGASIVLTGAPNNQRELEKVADQLPYPSTIVSDLPPRAFVAFLARCSALLCVDSGARHMANAAGIPVVFTRNPTDSAATAAYCESEYDLLPPGPSVPADKQDSLYADLTPEHVSRRVIEVLHSASRAALVPRAMPGASEVLQ